MEAGELITRSTAVAAFLGYVLSLALRLTNRSNPGRALWTLGCLTLILHISCAFEFVHHWSHDAAYQYTARQTAVMTGFDSGSGLLLNYAVALVWLADACWWWLADERYQSRPRWIEWIVQGFLAFMWFNATVVFGHRAACWIGTSGLVSLAVIWRLNSL
jgi:hypothetical protein